MIKWAFGNKQREEDTELEIRALRKQNLKGEKARQPRESKALLKLQRRRWQLCRNKTYKGLKAEERRRGRGRGY